MAGEAQTESVDDGKRIDGRRVVHEVGLPSKHIIRRSPRPARRLELSSIGSSSFPGRMASPPLQNRV